MAIRTQVTISLASLPPFPQIANDVLRILKDPTAPVQRVVRLVEKDVSLTTAVLKLANSGLYGRHGTVGSVPSAFRALGVETFSEVVLRTALRRYVDNCMPIEDLNRCWAHCVACSEISKILATRLDFPPDLALSAGLLHDIGRFGLALASPAKHNQLLNGSFFPDVMEAERELFGLDHTEAGRILAEQLHLPDEIRISAGRHHDPLSGDETDLLSIVSLACAIASAVGFPVIYQTVPKTLEDVIASAPAAIRDHISPDVDFWTTALFQTFGRS